MRLIFISLFLLLTTAFAQTSLWKVSDGKHEIYIGGTIHVLRHSDYPLPREFDAAYKKADAVAFETDITQAQKPEFGKKLFQKLRYPQGRSLRDDLKRKTYLRLKKEMASAGLNMEHFDRFRVPMAVMSLMGLKLEKMGMNSSGVDDHFHKRALKDRKTLHFLEPIETQMDLIANMGKGHEDALVMQMLDELNMIDEVFVELTAAWRGGDLEKLDSYVLEPMLREYPELYDPLIKHRNDAWMDYLQPLIKKKQRVLVLVGALHLVGPDGLLVQFKKRGYRIEPF